MDYSPTPSRMKTDLGFLDESAKRRSVLGDRQKKFYSKYTDLKSPRKRDDDTTNSRLFRNIINEVPIDDHVKMQSNMVNKLLQEKQTLQNKHKEMLDIADSFKLKLTKYKNANDELKQELANIQETFNKENSKTSSEIEELKKQNQLLMQEIEALKNNNKEIQYDFNPEDTNDIFKEEVPEVPESKIESKLDQLFSELQFIKQLQQKSPETSSIDHEISSSTTITDSNQLQLETKEIQQLQDKVNELENILNIREENKIHKFKLKNQLNDLISKIEIDDIPKEFKTPVDSPDKLKKSCPTCSNIDLDSNTDDTTRWY